MVLNVPVEDGEQYAQDQEEAEVEAAHPEHELLLPLQLGARHLDVPVAPHAARHHPAVPPPPTRPQAFRHVGDNFKL